MDEKDIMIGLRNIDFHIFALCKERAALEQAINKFQKEGNPNCERLTEYDEFGNANVIGVDSANLQLHLSFDEFNKVTEALNRLARFEDERLAQEGSR